MSKLADPPNEPPPALYWNWFVEPPGVPPDAAPIHPPLTVAKHPPERRIPFANVEVAVEEALSPPLSMVRPETWSLFWNVEDAEAIRFVREERPLTARVEEAEIAPVTLRLEEKVEEADAMSPPEALTEKMGWANVEEAFVTWSAFPVCVVRTLRLRRLVVVALVEVAAMVSMEAMSAVVVPIAKMSFVV